VAVEVAVIVSDDALVRRLVEVLEPAVVTVVVCPPDVTLHPPGARRVVLGPPGDARAFVRAAVRHPDALHTLPEWVLWGNDMDLIRTARSSIPLAVKTRVLPVRRERGLAILGSKTGLAELAKELRLPAPRSVVVADPAGLVPAAATFAGPLLLKGERGGGSDRLRPFADPADVTADCVPAHWFPVLLQEFVEGREIAVEALFGHGRLLGWQYSVSINREERFGRHLARRFVAPPSLDFVDTLERFADAVEAHGFANCTFMRTADGQHLLVEADLRANAWHQFGPRLGVPWGRLLAVSTEAPEPSGPPGPPTHPVPGVDLPRTIRLYPRELVHGLRAGDPGALTPWLLRAPGTWATRNHRDRRVNAVERSEVLTTATSVARAGVRAVVAPARRRA